METSVVLLIIVIIMVGIWAFWAITEKAGDLLSTLVLIVLGPLFVSKSKKERYLRGAVETLRENWKERCDSSWRNIDCTCEWCTILATPSRDRRDFLTQVYREVAQILPDDSLWQLWAFRSASSNARVLNARLHLVRELKRSDPPS